jgi:hypothetical protein
MQTSKAAKANEDIHGISKKKKKNCRTTHDVISVRGERFRVAKKFEVKVHILSIAGLSFLSWSAAAFTIDRPFPILSA